MCLRVGCCIPQTFPVRVLAAISDGGAFQSDGTGTVFIDQETDVQ